MKKLFYCQWCWAGTYNRNLLLWDDDLPNHRAEGGSKEGHHWIAEIGNPRNEREEYIREYVLNNLIEDS